MSLSLEHIHFFLTQLGWRDLLDLLFVGIVLYKVFILTKKSGAIQILTGLLILSVAYFLSTQLELATLHWILEKFFSHLFLIVVILFQGEIRMLLAQMGSRFLTQRSALVEETHVMEEIAKGALVLAQNGYGALVVIEGEMGLDYFMEKGVELDSIVSSDLLKTIFHPQSPLHDGAVIVRGTRIYAARCFLPLSQNPNLDRNLGTRHRAAIGLAEGTDALVIVVSEETHSVGLVHGGDLIPNVDLATIRQKLYEVSSVKYPVVEEKKNHSS